MSRSIRFRVVAAMLVILVPAIMGSSWLLIRAFGDRMVRDIDLALEEEADTVAGMVASVPTLNAAAVDSLARRVAAETDLGALKYVTIRVGERALAEAPPGALATLRSGDPALRLIAHETQAGGSTVSVTIGVSAAAALRAQRQLTWLLGIGAPALLLVLAAGLWVAVGRALEPLARASSLVAAIDPADLEVRLPQPSGNDEVARMVGAINGLLERLERSAGELRRFIANAAHELRTPLTVLRTGIEVALGRSDRAAAEYREALAGALASASRLSRTAEDLLTLTRLESAAAPGPAVDVDVAEALREVIDAWEESAGERRIRLELDAGTGLVVAARPDDLYRLFSNLLDNAVRHGKLGGAVMIRAARSDGRILVDVADDGPGLPESELERIFEPFHRGRTVEADRPGSGLGLGIAREIARGHGGDLSAKRNERGGLTFRVSLAA